MTQESEQQTPEQLEMGTSSQSDLQWTMSLPDYEEVLLQMTHHIDACSTHRKVVA